MITDYNRIKNKFWMFDNIGTHGIIETTKNVKLILAHKDLQFFFSEDNISDEAKTILHKSYKVDGTHSLSSSSLTLYESTFKKTYEEIAEIMIDFHIKNTVYDKWYKYTIREQKLKRILK